ncbi:MAG: polyprenyl diphosphate synthase [Candidatus Micrarchaeota archaeon]
MEKLVLYRIKNYIAINRRWAKENKKSIKEGYATGIGHIGEVLKWCKESEVKMLTMWGFSTENFDRDENEVSTLFELFTDNLKKAIMSDEKGKYNVRVRFFGRLGLFPVKIQEMIKKAEELSKQNTEYQLNLLLAYGGRQEIVDAVNQIISKGIKKVDEKIIEENLYTASLPHPDLVIRTSGEERLSGLMSWQTSYSELYFSKKLWPDFTKADFDDALKEYANRMRRFGK